MPLFEGNLFTQRHQISSYGTRDPRLSYGENPESLSHLGLNRYRVVTDRQTDRIPIANTRSQQCLPVQLSRVKTDELSCRIVDLDAADYGHYRCVAANSLGTDRQTMHLFGEETDFPFLLAFFAIDYRLYSWFVKCATTLFNCKVV